MQSFQMVDRPILAEFLKPLCFRQSGMEISVLSVFIHITDNTNIMMAKNAESILMHVDFGKLVLATWIM